MSHLGLLRELMDLISEHQRIQESTTNSIERLNTLRCLSEKVMLYSTSESQSYQSLTLSEDILQLRRSYRYLVTTIESVISSIQDDLANMNTLNRKSKALLTKGFGCSKNYFLKHKKLTTNQNESLPSINLEESIILFNTVWEDIREDLTVKGILFNVLLIGLRDPNYSNYSRIINQVTQKWSKSMVNYKLCDTIHSLVKISNSRRSNY